jgi:hypothetical protein
MRPSKLNTPLAVLRNMLTVETSRKDHKSRVVKARARLSVKDVAGWIGLSVSSVNSLESGGRMGLTRANAELIMSQTAVNYGWITGGNPKAPVIDWYGHPYTQETFDERQAELKRDASNPKMEAHKVTIDLAKGVAFLAATLLHAYQTGQGEVCARRMVDTLRQEFIAMSGGMDHNGLVSKFIARHTITRPDLGRILGGWEEGLKTEMAAKAKITKRRR